MKNMLIVLGAWLVMLIILSFTPWLFIILGSLFGLKIELGVLELSTPGLIKGIKELEGKK